jgi:ribosomal protein S13
VEKGIGIGVEKGIGIGVEKAAQNGILAGLSNDVIKLMTKLTDEQIDNIREELKKSGA